MTQLAYMFLGAAIALAVILSGLFVAHLKLYRKCLLYDRNYNALKVNYDNLLKTNTVLRMANEQIIAEAVKGGVDTKLINDALGGLSKSGGADKP